MLPVHNVSKGWSGARRTVASRAAFLLHLLAAPLMAQGGEQAAVTVQRRDSAGINIVLNTVTASAPPIAFSVDTASLLVLSRAGTGDSAASFRRLGDARVLRSGNIAIGDDFNSRVHLFSRYGTYLRSVGGRSTGPGELASVRLMDNRGDTLVVCCAPGVSLYGAAGNHLTTTPPFREEFLGVLQTGRFLVRRTTSETQAYQGQKGVVKSLLMDTLFLVDARGTFSGRVAALPSRVHVGVFNPDPNPLGMQITYIESPFEPEAFYAPSGNAFYYSDGRNFEARLYTAAGRMTRMIRLARPPLPITASLAEAYRQIILRKYPVVETRRYVEWVLSQYVVPGTMPAIRAMEVAGDGRLWMREHAFPVPAEVRWHVFSADGVYEGIVNTPSRWKVHHIGADFMLVSEPASANTFIFSMHRISRTR